MRSVGVLGHRWARLAVSGAAAAGLVCPAIVPVTAGATTAGRVPGVSLTPATTACPLPVTRDVYDGFHVGVPAGWEVSTFRGEVEVSKDATGTEGALIYPALATKGLTAAGFFSAFLHFEQKQTSGGGGSLSYRLLPDVNGLPRASITVRHGATATQGQAMVLALPVHTQLASSQFVFFAYWAPPAHLGADRSMLTSIGACYGAQRADLFHVFQDQVFTYILPPGWKVGDEGSDNIDLHYAPGADVSFLLFGPWVQGVNVPQPVGTPQLALNYILAQTGIRVTHVLWSLTSPNQTTSTGAVEALEYMEFTGVFKGLAVHGFVYVGTSTGGGSTAGVERLGLANANLWNSVNGGLVQMMGAVQHSFTQDLTELQHVNQQWQDFSGQVANFDDALNSQQLVQDPSTGGLYEAPYSSWDPNGPDGPGYYLPNGQRLNPVSRP